MPTGNKQIRNDQMEELLKGTFVTRKEFMRDGARMLSAVFAMNRALDGTIHAGGQLVEGFMADSVQANGMAATASIWTQLNLNILSWSATNNGGPFLTFGGTSALYIADAAWQEATTRNMFVWKWVKLAATGSSQTIESKYDTNGNQCSWRLWYDSTGPAFTFTTNAGGGAGADVSVASTHTVGTADWYFVAGYIGQTAGLMRILVGTANEQELTETNLALGVPGNLFNTTAPLTLGTSWNNAGALTVLDPLIGYLGIGHLRFNTPYGTAPSYPGPTGCAARLFQLSRWFYLE